MERIEVTPLGVALKLSKEEISKRFKITEIWRKVYGMKAADNLAGGADDWAFLIALLDHKDN